MSMLKTKIGKDSKQFIFANISFLIPKMIVGMPWKKFG
jgi:hypothetical protein